MAGNFKPAGVVAESAAAGVAAAAGLTGPPAPPPAAWMELVCCAGSGGTGEAGAHSGLSMPAIRNGTGETKPQHSGI